MPTTPRSALIIGLLTAGLCACTTTSPTLRPVLDAHWHGGRTRLSLAQLANQMSVPSAENIVVQTLAHDAHTSQHLVGVRDREAPHRHDKSAMTVVVLRGHGTMSIEGVEQAVLEGSVIYVPAGVAHAFINRGPEPSVALVTFSPAFDPADRLPATAATPAP